MDRKDGHARKLIFINLQWNGQIQYKILLYYSFFFTKMFTQMKNPFGFIYLD